MSTMVALDLDDELAQHLADSQSVNALRSEEVSADLIRDDGVRRMYEWQLGHIREHKRPASAVVLAEEFDWYEPEAPKTAVGDLISRLRTRYVRNEGRDALRGLIETAIEDPLAVAREMQREAKRLQQLTATRGEMWGTGDGERAIDEYHRFVLEGKGPTLGFDELDSHFTGVKGVTVLIAPPKGMKSWVTGNAAVENVLAGKRAYVFSLELPAWETWMRMVSLAAQVPPWKYLKKMLSEKEIGLYQSVARELDANGIFSVEKPPPGQRTVASMVAKAMDAGADVIFIDQLQYVEDRKGNSIGSTNDTGKYFEVCNDLRDASDDIPVFLVHQFNRTVIGATEMPDMQQAKGSAAVEEVATLLLGMWASKEMRLSKSFQLGTLASRHFDHKMWEVTYNFASDCMLRIVGEIDES